MSLQNNNVSYHLPISIKFSDDTGISKSEAMSLNNFHCNNSFKLYIYIPTLKSRYFISQKTELWSTNLAHIYIFHPVNTENRSPTIHSNTIFAIFFDVTNIGHFRLLLTKLLAVQTPRLHLGTFPLLLTAQAAICHKSLVVL